MDEINSYPGVPGPEMDVKTSSTLQISPYRTPTCEKPALGSLWFKPRRWQAEAGCGPSYTAQEPCTRHCSMHVGPWDLQVQVTWIYNNDKSDDKRRTLSIWGL